MTDNRTTELREKLTERGVEWRDKSNGYVTITAYTVNGIEWNAIAKHYIGREHDWMKLRSDTNVTPEQAIAATLVSERHPYEQRITGDGSDWGEIMCDAFDSLMAAACDACTFDELERFRAYIMKEMGE